MYPSLWIHMEYFYCTKIFYALSIPFFPHHSPQQLLIFLLISVVLPLSECHIVVIIQCIAFLYWLPSLSNIHWNFLYVFLWLDRSLLFSTEYYLALLFSSLSGCATVYLLLTYWRAAWLFSGFGNYKQNCCVQVFVWISVFNSLR